MSGVPPPRLHEQMSVILKQMQEYYKCLTQKQTQAITTVPDKLLDLLLMDAQYLASFLCKSVCLWVLLLLLAKGLQR